MPYVFWHCCVNLARQFNKARVFTIFTRFPTEVEWIHWDTVTAPSRTRIERHEPKGLRLCRFDNFPDVNSHSGVNEFELVNQCNIDAAENILQQLRSFGDATRRDRYKRVDRLTISRHGTIEAGWRVSSYNLGNQFNLILFVSRIFAFRG